MTPREAFSKAYSRPNFMTPEPIGYGSMILRDRSGTIHYELSTGNGMGDGAMYAATFIKEDRNRITLTRMDSDSTMLPEATGKSQVVAMGMLTSHVNTIRHKYNAENPL